MKSKHAVLFYQECEKRNVCFLIIYMGYSAGSKNDISSSLSFVSRFECMQMTLCRVHCYTDAGKRNFHVLVERKDKYKENGEVWGNKSR